MEPITGTRIGNLYKILMIACIVFTILMVLLYYALEVSVDTFINPVSLGPIAGLVLLFLYVFLQFIDKKPLLIIADDGIAIRNSRIPFSELETIDWEDIAGYSIRTRLLKYGANKFLVIERRSIKRKYIVDLLDLDTNNRDVLDALAIYAQQYGFNQ